ncbi:lymphocyte-specific helicase-like isoform X1 [Lingula anatina]|uniref:Proliferation-associated SNF2-like protein n=1 Tax=Lingula anatina TaxID=7574 RepID=A0A1S3HHX6_LINAN|nr:lymphocyte-specific helicase-like isoform X1 [Lingula anatina]|eukprot:XP_013385622.1 lymphocyte-specific helicase-like isoform X1 [Lingula anatina]
MKLTTETRTESPVKPLSEEADEPKENADKLNMITGAMNEGDENPFPSKTEKTSELLPSSEVSEPKAVANSGAKEATAEEEDEDRVTPSSLLTDAMIKEEKQLHEETVEEEQRIRTEGHKEIENLNEKLKEERYKKLQFLLSKSNLYTKYLLERMNRQQQEEAKRCEQQKKKLAREAEKKKQEEEKQSSQESLSQSPDLRKSSRKGASQDTTVQSPKGQARTNQAGAKKGVKRKAQQKPPGAEEKDSKRIKTDDGPLDIACEPTTPAKVPAIPDFLLGKKHPDQPLLCTGGVLRNYQIEGFKWLQCLYENGVNGILADEMGLGKTIQCIAAVADLVMKGVNGPFLIVAPLSTLPNWVTEFARFAPRIPVVLYHGPKQDREKMTRKIHRDCEVAKNVRTSPVVITSYEIAMKDRTAICNFEWKYLIVDEGHRIKNFQCRLIRELKMYRSTHRLLLTGTPLQNNLSELWSLLNFLLPEIFDDLGSFETWFDIEYISESGADEKIVQEEQQKNILSMLHQILTPFLLRRLKSDVDLNIPPKREIMVYACLTKVQKAFYEATVDGTILNLLEKKKEPVKAEKVQLDSKGRPVRKTKKKVNYELMMEAAEDDKASGQDQDSVEDWVSAIIENQEKTATKATSRDSHLPKTSEITVKMQNVMMQLRKCCNHPYLLEYPLDPKTGNYKVDEELVKKCGKMMLLDKMLTELKRTGHKVLLFSQMTKMLDILEDFCYLRQYQYSRLDGSKGVEERKEQIEAFNTDPEIFLFLLSTRAGGLGINLVAADTVIIYDSDWNPQSDLQAQDRCHRIGQTKPVLIYRLVTANTYDQKIVERAAAKRKLEKMVIHKGKFKVGMKSFTDSLKPVGAPELLQLLKSKDHDEEVKGREGQVISKRDLDKLLDRTDLMEKWINKNQEQNENDTKKDIKKKRKEQYTDVEGVFKVLEEDTGRTGFESSGN